MKSGVCPVCDRILPARAGAGRPAVWCGTPCARVGRLLGLGAGGGELVGAVDALALDMGGAIPMEVKRRLSQHVRMASVDILSRGVDAQAAPK